MFESIIKFFKKLGKQEKPVAHSKDTAKERLHLVLMQDRANVSADFLDLMKQEIIEVIKKYIDVDENAIDVKLTNKTNEDGTTGAPALYANIPIISIKEEAKKEVKDEMKKEEPKEQEAKEIETLEDVVEVEKEVVEIVEDQNKEEVKEVEEEKPEEVKIENEKEETSNNKQDNGEESNDTTIETKK